MSELQQLEQQRADIQEALELRDAALRLSENKDFRRLFIEMYFKSEAARLVQMSGDPVLNKDQREDALNMAQATGHAKRFLSMLVVRGNTLSRDVEDLEQQIIEARQEEENAQAEAANGSDEADARNGGDL
jgi:hypothetical protein